MYEEFCSWLSILILRCQFYILFLPFKFLKILDMIVDIHVQKGNEIRQYVIILSEVLNFFATLSSSK